MKLCTPGDFDILEYLDTHGRNVAANIYEELDVSRGYVNSELGKLEDYGLVRKVGPNSKSGLYEITEKGRITYENRSVYHDDSTDFEEFLAAELDARNANSE